MTLEQYINKINQRYKAGLATEYTFRGSLEQLIETILPAIKATNESKRQSCGTPDYILTKKDIPVGFIEAKDIENQYFGSQLSNEKYITLRDAGNFLAACVSRMGGLSEENTFSLFGAFQLAGNRVLPISHAFQRRGYDHNVK